MARRSRSRGEVTPEAVADVRPKKKIVPNRAFDDDPAKYPQTAEENQGETFEAEGQIFQKPTPVVPEGNAPADVK